MTDAPPAPPSDAAVATSSTTDAPALGFFYPALAVKDLATSLAFYGALGFELECAGPPEKWAMIKNGGVRMGLYEGMFPADMLSFNPPDARAVQAAIEAAGGEIMERADGTEGPCHVVAKDPDGRAMMFQQF